jgi:hypothetical protein
LKSHQRVEAFHFKIRVGTLHLEVPDLAANRVNMTYAGKRKEEQRAGAAPLLLYCSAE